MRIVTLPPTRVLIAERELRLLEAGEFLRRSIAAIEDDAHDRKLAFAGPWIFVSHNLPQDTETSFRFAVCRPVEDTPDAAPGAFEIVDLPEFHGASREYEGPLSGIHRGGYVPLLEDIFAVGTTLTGEIREVHHVRDTPESRINQVEIQIGLVPDPEPESVVLSDDVPAEPTPA